MHDHSVKYPHCSVSLSNSSLIALLIKLIDWSNSFITVMFFQTIHAIHVYCVYIFRVYICVWTFSSTGHLLAPAGKSTKSLLQIQQEKTKSREGSLSPWPCCWINCKQKMRSRWCCQVATSMVLSCCCTLTYRFSIPKPSLSNSRIWRKIFLSAEPCAEQTHSLESYGRVWKLWTTSWWTLVGRWRS